METRSRPGEPDARVEEPAKEDLSESKQIERFDIPLDSLKRMFEKPAAAVAAETAAGAYSSVEVKGSLSPRRGTAAHSHTPPRDLTIEGSSTDRMSTNQELNSSAGSTAVTRDAEDTVQRNGDPETEGVSVKERLAMYQAAVAKKETSASSAGVLEETEACSLPGGLASVKKQFESQEFSTSSSSHSTITHVQSQHRVQEMSSSQTQRVTFNENEQVSREQQSFHQNHVAAGYENHFDETVRMIGGEDLPKVSAQALKQQYEKTIEEATPSKQVKIDLDYNQFQWAPVNVSSKVIEDGHYETVAVTRRVEAASSSSTSASASTKTTEIVEQQNFPPPPTEFLQGPGEVPVRCSSPQPKEYICPHHHAKDYYSKQRNMAELKRLYKHIHPEVRKNLERDFFSQEMAYQEEMSGEIQQARSVFENSSSPSKCMSPEREYLEWDEILKGEVQSMRWMFENKPLDSIKDETPDEDNSKNIAQQEIIAGSDVKYTAWMFETQPIDALRSDTPDSTEQTGKMKELARGDVRTATWLFETQALDTLNKIYQEDNQGTEVVYTKDIAGGDVKTARYLFETQHLDTLAHTETIDETHFLSLKSELEEIKGEVKMTTRMFETQPMCVIRGDSGEMLEITTVRREETEKGDVKTSRWLFETQPLDMISKDPSQVKLICGVSMEDNYQGGVNKGRWLFETKTLDSIKDEEWESSKLHREEIIGADVRKHCMVFETQPMDSLKDNANARPTQVEDIVGGNVTSARHLFETVPMENLKELAEVGKLQKRVMTEEEKGDVRHQRWMFETRPLEQIREEKKEVQRTVNLEELDKGDVTNYKEIFETMDLSKCDTQKIQVEGVTSGSVRSNKHLFESTPMYAMQDSSGHYHEVKTIRREEIVKGDVRSCKWMFETRPIDQFDESIDKFQIIKGISKQEIESGDVKTAKWLFETQPLDGIKYFSNAEEEETRKKEGVHIEQGDVKTCRWLFETQPMDALYEKVEAKSETESTEVQKGDVKTCTWLFETQALDTIRDESETVIKTCTVDQEEVQGKDVRLARFLFETENLENITGESESDFKRVTEIDIQSGDVSRMKYIFENRSSDIMTSTSEETMMKLKSRQAEEIQKGNVVNCTWMFENQPIDAIRDASEESKEIRTVSDVQGGNVDKGRFIFETYSLDKIQDESSETEIKNIQSTIREEIEKGDVKNYTMMFETQPLYAIRDKEGHYHEVTTVTKEEILRGDVVGARWLFETKPLDSIRDTDEVYIIKAVTEEDVQKGDVRSARWKFETQPLDEIAEDLKVRMKTVEDIQGGDVKINKQRFEEDQMNQYVRTVSVSEIQKGDVRSSTWLFETRTIDKIRGEGSEYDEMEKVTKEEVVKGDVKQSVWLFEKEPLDRIKEMDGTETVISREEIPQADVKSTTWLFESTPLTGFNESNVERTEIIGKSIKNTLEELYSQKMVESQGILIETDEVGDVRMAKYKLMNQEAPEIQREEVIRGDLNNIMMNLLNRCEGTEKCITIDQEERGNINTTVKQLFNQERGINVEKEEIIRGDIQEAINNLLKEEGANKRGILIQEDEKGDVRMTIYSLLNKDTEEGLDKEDIVRGNVRGTLHRLLSNPDASDQSKIRVSDTERGNVSFYSTCIESGALDYLRQLQTESDDTVEGREKEKIIGGDVETTKLLLRKNQKEIGRTVTEEDILRGDVHSTVKVFMTKPEGLHNLQKEEIVKGDLRAALDSLTQAVNQRAVLEKEEVVKGDINITLRSLVEAQNQAKEVEKPEIVRGDIRGALESLEKSANTRTEIIIEDLVPGDIKGTLKSLEEAKQALKEVEKEEIVKGDIHMALINLQEASSDKKVYQHQVSEYGDVKGTIQLLLEPTASPRMQRRASTEGDIKTSIKSLYEQEEMQVEKEEVVKGDVRGAIHCLLQKKDEKHHKGHNVRRVKGKTPLHECPECLAAAMAESRAASQAFAMTNQTGTTESQNGAQEVTQVHLEQNIEATSQGGQSTVTQTTAVQQMATEASQSSQQSLSQQQTNVQEQQIKEQQAIVKEQEVVKEPVKPKMDNPGPMLIKKKNIGKQMTESTAVAGSGTVVTKETSQVNITTKQTQEIKTIKQVQTSVTTEQKTATQKQTIKNLKLGYGSTKGLIKKNKPQIDLPPPPVSPPPPSESELSLPPPPSPITDSDVPPPLSRPLVMRQDSDLPLPPPPPPPTAEAETEFFPPPPPPQDFLPPPPPPQELSAVAQPSPAKPKARPLFKVPKPEPPKQAEPPKFKWQKKQPPAPQPPPPPPPPPPAPVVEKQETSATATTIKEESSKHVEQIKQTTLEPPVSKIPSVIPVAKPVQEEPPRPPKKVFVPPIKLPPPPETTAVAKPKTYARKFKTPLMLAEERYRKQMEEAAKSKVTTPTSPPTQMHLQAPGEEAPATESTGLPQPPLPNEPEIVAKPTPVPQEPPTKKMPTQIPMVKPTINKKLTQDSTSMSSVTSKKHQTVSSGMTQGTHSLSTDVQASSSMASSSASEQQQTAVKTSSETSVSKQEAIQQVSSSATQEAKKAPSQPMKIPKVTPNFKVKTIKPPKVEAESKQEENAAQKEQVAINATAQMNQKSTQSVTQMGTAQQNSESLSSSTQKVTEVTVEQVGKAATSDSKVEIQMKKSKQKSKKEVKQVVPIQVSPVPPMTVEVPKGQGQVTIVQSHQEVKEKHVQIREEVVVTESQVQQQSIQQKSKIQIKKQVKSSQQQQQQKQMQQLQQKEMSKQEVSQISSQEMKQTESVAEITDSQKYVEVQKLLSQIKEMQSVHGKLDANSVKAMVISLPDWLIGTEEKTRMVTTQFSKQKLKEVIVHIRNIAQAKLIFIESNVQESSKPESEPEPEKVIIGGATPKISKISIGSARVETQKKVKEERRSTQEIKEQDLSKTRTPEPKVPSDTMRMRTPSPTFISIESSRRTDSPFRVSPSPPPSFRSDATPTPPPRWVDTPTKLSRATPSPTMSRSHKLTKLKDNTTKVAQTPPPMPVPEHMMMMHTAEMEEESLSSSHQEFTMESHSVEMFDVSEAVDSMMTVKDKRVFFEEAQKAEVNKTYMRKDPIDIPERLGGDAEEDAESAEIQERMKEDLPRVDLSKLVNKFESPQPKMYVRRDPILIPERLGSDTEEGDAEIERRPTPAEEKPSFDIKAIKNVFELGEPSFHHVREEKEKDATGFSETQSITEHYSTVDEFGNTVTGSRTETSMHSENVSGIPNPPTYADVVRGNVPVLSVSPDASAEELLQSFQQSWADSETVFRNLGFSATEEQRSQMMSHQRESIVTGKAV
ncbi:hypothetical protein AALO_G00290150 [Alosa alosa]|uniref:Xin actin-binding repeat-containing protein 2 n=1 Tax=Alosa alosa TaxID=278164 RepID=A0AAV6FGK0_9TELE|nr:hypothetical protein AALO_G00290150 [Alosa alosa]